MAQLVARRPMNFLEMLAQNPRGWGPVGPASPEEGVGDPNEMERGQNALAMFGPIAEAAAPYLPQKGREMAEEAAAQAPYAALGPTGRLVRAAPRAAGAIAAGLGLTAASSGAGKGSEGALQQLMEQKALLMQQRNDALARQNQNRPKSLKNSTEQSDPNYWNATKEVLSLDAKLESIDELIGREKHMSSPEYQMEMAQKAAALEAERKEKEAKTPFRQKHPAAAEALAWGGTAAAAALPFMLRGKTNLGTLLPGSNASRINKTVREANRAIDMGDIEKAKRLALELEHLVGKAPAAASKGKSAKGVKGVMDMAMRAGGHVAKAGGGAAAGGVLAAEGSMLPDQIDMGMLPEGEARTKAREAALNPMNYLDRAVTGTLTGLGGHEAGGLVPAKNPNIAGARAIIDYLSQAGRKAPARAKDVGVKRVTRKPRGKGAND
jgi:hypothetical protein